MSEGMLSKNTTMDQSDAAATLSQLSSHYDHLKLNFILIHYLFILFNVQITKNEKFKLLKPKQLMK